MFVGIMLTFFILCFFFYFIYSLYVLCWYILRYVNFDGVNKLTVDWCECILCVIIISIILTVICWYVPGTVEHLIYFNLFNFKNRKTEYIDFTYKFKQPVRQEQNENPSGLVLEPGFITTELSWLTNEIWHWCHIFRT